MKKLTLRLLLSLLILLVLAGCNSDPDCDPDFVCDTTYPTSGNLSLRVSINDENPWVAVAVYKGFIEDSALYFVDTLYTDHITYSVDLEQRYSGSATYKSGSQRIVAIDGDKVGYKSEDNCGYTCYTLQDGALKLDLR